MTLYGVDDELPDELEGEKDNAIPVGKPELGKADPDLDDDSEPDDAS